MSVQGSPIDAPQRRAAAVDAAPIGPERDEPATVALSAAPSLPHAVWSAEPGSTVAAGLEAILAGSGRFAYRGALDLREARTWAGVGTDDIVLVDPTRLSDPPEGPRWAGELPCRLVAFTDRRADTFVLGLLACGFSGFLLKSSSRDEVFAVLEQVAAGGRAVVGSEVGALAITAPELPGLRCWPGITQGLSHRESEVLVGLGSGWTTAQIAERLVLGEETIRTHLRSLYRKLGAGDRCAAVAAAFRLGILA